MPFILRRLGICFLISGVQHIFYEYSVSLGGVCDHNVCDRADELAVLDNRAAGHECGQEGTTVFNKKFTTKYWLNFCRNSL